MAEFVEITLERGITELEKLAALKLFEPSEISKIAQQRRDNAYNLQKRTKDKLDYIRYIRFEEDLLERIRGKLHTAKGRRRKTSQVADELTQRINVFFRNTVIQYRSDLDLWMDYFKFCEAYKLIRSGNKMLQNLFQVHGDKPHLWIFASNWALKRIKRGEKPNYETGRMWLVKGLERHPTNKELYTALIKFDLDLAKMWGIRGKRKNSNHVEEIKTALACAEVSYKNAVKNIQDAEFVASLLKLISHYSHTEQLKQIATENLQNSFAESEESWNGRALCAYEQARPPTHMPLKELQRFREDSCLQIFQDAIQHIPTKLMWSKYIQWLKAASTNRETANNLRSKLFKSILPAAIEQGMASAEDYPLLADYQLNAGKTDNAVATLRKGLSLHSELPALWYELVRVHLSVGQDEEAVKAFREAIAQLKKVPAKDTLKIWTMLLGYLMEEDKNKDTVEAIYQDGVRYNIELAQLLKPKYLEWRLVAYGLDKARELLNMTHVVNPPCLAFYQKLAEIETNQSSPDLSRARYCHEAIVRLFGKDNEELWLDFINFEMNHGDVSKVIKIYQRGLHELNKDRVDALVAKYSISF